MIPTLSQVCSLSSPAQGDITDYAAGQCRSLELWLTKVENFLAAHSLSEFRQRLADEDMLAPVASMQGGLLTSQGDMRSEAWNLFRRRLDLCANLAVNTLVVAGDVPAPLDETVLERLKVSLVQAAREAQSRNVRIALEFQSRAAFPNNLQSAAALVHELGEPALGLCFDAFHFYTGPSKTEDLGYLTAANLFHVQLCDLADVPREFAADADRILPGDGDLPLDYVVRRLREIHYAGPVSVELLNPGLWQVPARQFGEIALTALRKVLGQAAM